MLLSIVFCSGKKYKNSFLFICSGATVGKFTWNEASSGFRVFNSLAVSVNVSVIDLKNPSNLSELALTYKRNSIRNQN